MEGGGGAIMTPPRYRSVKVLGQGSFGKAILVEDQTTKKLCVVKQINFGKLLTPKERAETQQEARLLSSLKHPNIVSYIDSYLKASRTGSYLYIVMEYADGGDLRGLIKRRRGNLLPEGVLLDIFVQICLAVKHLHDRKIVHRDLKSENIFLMASNGIVKVGDLGIAKVLQGTTQFARTKIGTPLTMSPEILMDQPYNQATDLWSLGCILYELASLCYAFQARDMRSLIQKIIRAQVSPLPPQYSIDLRHLVSQLLSRDIRQRPSINTVLRRGFIRERISKFLPQQEIQNEFSHTILHGFHPLVGVAEVVRRESAPPKPSPVSRPSPHMRVMPRVKAERLAPQPRPVARERPPLHAPKRAFVPRSPANQPAVGPMAAPRNNKPKAFAPPPLVIVGSPPPLPSQLRRDQSPPIPREPTPVDRPQVAAKPVEISPPPSSAAALSSSSSSEGGDDEPPPSTSPSRRSPVDDPPKPSLAAPSHVKTPKEQVRNRPGLERDYQGLKDLEAQMQQLRQQISHMAGRGCKPHAPPVIARQEEAKAVDSIPPPVRPIPGRGDENVCVGIETTQQAGGRTNQEERKARREAFERFRQERRNSGPQKRVVTPSNRPPIDSGYKQPSPTAMVNAPSTKKKKNHKKEVQAKGPGVEERRLERERQREEMKRLMAEHREQRKVGQRSPETVEILVGKIPQVAYPRRPSDDGCSSDEAFGSPPDIPVVWGHARPRSRRDSWEEEEEEEEDEEEQDVPMDVVEQAQGGAKDEGISEVTLRAGAGLGEHERKAGRSCSDIDQRWGDVFPLLVGDDGEEMPGELARPPDRPQDIMIENAVIEDVEEGPSPMLEGILELEEFAYMCNDDEVAEQEEDVILPAAIPMGAESDWIFDNGDDEEPEGDKKQDVASDLVASLYISPEASQRMSREAKEEYALILEAMHEVLQLGDDDNEEEAQSQEEVDESWAPGYEGMSEHYHDELDGADVKGVIPITALEKTYEEKEARQGDEAAVTSKVNALDQQGYPVEVIGSTSTPTVCDRLMRRVGLRDGMSTASQIEAVRLYLENVLGLDRFIVAYQVLRAIADEEVDLDDAIRIEQQAIEIEEVLGPAAPEILPILHRLLELEESFF